VKRNPVTRFDLLVVECPGLPGAATEFVAVGPSCLSYTHDRDYTKYLPKPTKSEVGCWSESAGKKYVYWISGWICDLDRNCAFWNLINICRGRHCHEVSSWRWWSVDWTCTNDLCWGTQNLGQIFASSITVHPNLYCRTWLGPWRLDMARPIEEINSVTGLGNTLRAQGHRILLVRFADSFAELLIFLKMTLHYFTLFYMISWGSQRVPFPWGLATVQAGKRTVGQWKSLWVDIALAGSTSCFRTSWKSPTRWRHWSWIYRLM
jgi:hypothetical protein